MRETLGTQNKTRTWSRIRTRTKQQQKNLTKTSQKNNDDNNKIETRTKQEHTHVKDNSRNTRGSDWVWGREFHGRCGAWLYGGAGTQQLAYIFKQIRLAYSYVRAEKQEEVGSALPPILSYTPFTKVSIPDLITPPSVRPLIPIPYSRTPPILRSLTPFWTTPPLRKSNSGSKTYTINSFRLFLLAIFHLVRPVILIPYSLTPPILMSLSPFEISLLYENSNTVSQTLWW